MSFSVSGKTAIVTGAANGIGLAIARHLADQGANVMCADADEKHLVQELGTEAEDGNIRFIHSSGAAPKRVVDEDRDNADVLRLSKYSVTGNITGNDQVIHKWLTGGFWPTSK